MIILWLLQELVKNYIKFLGSGKSASFLIPIIEKLSSHSQIVGCRSLIICPTRELALQTAKFFKEFSKFTDLKMAVLVGGASLEGEFEILAQNPDIVIACPGRVLHHAVKFSWNYFY